MSLLVDLTPVRNGDAKTPTVDAESIISIRVQEGRMTELLLADHNGGVVAHQVELAPAEVVGRIDDTIKGLPVSFKSAVANTAVFVPVTDHTTNGLHQTIFINTDRISSIDTKLGADFTTVTISGCNTPRAISETKDEIKQMAQAVIERRLGL